MGEGQAGYSGLPLGKWGARSPAPALHPEWAAMLSEPGFLLYQVGRLGVDARPSSRGTDPKERV